MREAIMFFVKSGFHSEYKKNLLMPLAEGREKEPFWNEKCQTTIFFFTSLPLEPNLLGVLLEPNSSEREGNTEVQSTSAILFCPSGGGEW